MKTIVLSAFTLLAVLNGIHGQPTDGELKQICTPGSRTKVDCNTCTCSKDGTALGCTRMACPEIPAEFLNPDGSLKLPHESNPLLRLRRSESNGQATDGEPKQICTPGSQTKVDCNTCTCSQDGTALGCTRMACPKIPAEFLNPDGSLKLPHQSSPLPRIGRSAQICEPGTTRTWKCNNCRCNPDGTAEICTRRICPDLTRTRRDRGFRCTPNENYMDDCNHCRCSPDGRSAACTLMACLPSATLNNPLLRTKRDQICKPGTTRMHDCNRCHCSSDGTAEACTRKACPVIPRQ